MFRLFVSPCVYIRHVFGYPSFTHWRLPIIVPPLWSDRKVWSQAQKYQVSLGELFTLQNIAVSTVIGFKKFKLEFGFKITYLRINDKRNLVPKCSGFMTIQKNLIRTDHMMMSKTCIEKPRYARGRVTHKWYGREGEREKDMVADSLTGTRTFGTHLCV